VRRLLFVAGSALVLAGAALADPLDPRVRLVPADQARADAAVLRRTDLGSAWRGGASKTPSSLKAPVCPAVRPNYAKLTITGHAESRFDNGNGGLQVSSDAEVWKSLAQAKQHLEALLVPKLPRCVKYALLRSLGGTGVTLLPVEHRKLPKLGDVSAAYRAPIGVKAGGKTVTVLSDFLFLRKGRTEIYVNVVAPSNNADQLTSFELRIARAMLARVRA
jgi:hypothetical protein